MTATYEPFSATIRRVGDITIFELEGELDASSATNLAQAVETALTAGELHVVVDLAHVAFIDPTGIAALLDAHVQAADLGGRLRVQCPSVPAAHALETAGVAHLLEISADPVLEGPHPWVA